MQTNSSRQNSLDILRGIFIFLALWQHYSYYLNVWFVDFFRDQKSFQTIYGIYEAYMGQYLPYDNITAWASYHLIPWVSQVYLFLAAFNLSRKNRDEFKLDYKKKMSMFGLIFLFFTFENFLTAQTFGVAISFYPIQAWMVILALISTLYLFSTKAIIALGIFSLTRFLALDSDLGIEAFIQQYIHIDYEFDANPSYFLTSAVIGFLLGRSYFTSPKPNKVLWASISLGLVGCLIYSIWGIPNQIERTNIFAFEHYLIGDFLGSIYIWGIQLCVISSFLLLENKNLIPNIKAFAYMGIYSLPIFAFHKVFFIYIWQPIRLFIGALFSMNPVNTVYEIWPAIILCCLSVHIIRKTKILNLIFK